ncbi:MAG TPA: hypothetical protein PLN96_08770 [Zoogloea sp.]|uniref:hypothetical protein n=1 Tax=Zoogloea sp. TaxID=49181 RepID=UPI002D0BFB12|nr:hypothetical protein [Zoogloea sp.]HMW50920.1 hypothetical protein [Rhodocyclaceae bacterium]HMY49916.1 hypothetical protein [Rhodocyclaceae bacterium]HNB64774.1 hypothetical protein [Rhodocyclaceae bacterium]HNC79638.1 hypothetical protein [Rhodocyclaceae bacterium]HNI47943.1 hypothetical protein [Zoogloea sp.]
MMRLNSTTLNVLIASLLCGGCASTSVSDSLWTQVSGDGNRIVLRLDPEHPRLRQFASAQINLAADFVDDSGTPRTASLGGGSRVDAQTRVYTLPETLNNPPSGEICLYFSPADTRLGAFPIRARTAGGTDNSGFRYPDWEARVGAETRRRLNDRQKSGLDAQRNAAQRSVQQLQAELDKDQLASVEDCARRTFTAKADARGRDVIEPAAQAATARRICVRRTRELNLTSKFSVVDALGQFRNQLPSERSRQAGQFLTDWRNHFERTGADYVPELGSPREPLAIATDAETLAARPSLQPRDSIALIGAWLDAYDVCVQDTTHQLGHRYQLWQVSQGRSSDRAAAYSDYMAQECRGKFRRLNEQRALLADVDRQLGALPSAAPTSSPQAQNRNVSLNALACTLPPR